jgi:hypothetical protein
MRFSEHSNYIISNKFKLFAFLLGVAGIFIGSISSIFTIRVLAIPLALFVFFSQAEWLIALIFITWIVDFTWISEWLRYLRDFLIIILFIKSLFKNSAVPIVFSRVLKKPFVFLGIVTVFGFLLNLQNLAPGAILFGFRAHAMFFLFYLALIKMNYPSKFYQRILLFGAPLVIFQLPVQFYQRNQGLNWSNVSDYFVTYWDNNSGIFGLNGSLVLGSFLLCAAAVSASELMFRKRSLRNLLVIVLAPFSLAIGEVKYGLLVYPLVMAWAFRGLWGNARKFVVGMLIVILIVSITFVAIINLDVLANMNINYLSGENLLKLWQAQFVDISSDTNTLNSGRIGLLNFVAAERAQSGLEILQHIFGNGIGSVSNSTYSLFQGYLYKKYPFDGLARTDFSRLWIELGWLGVLGFGWIYWSLFWRCWLLSKYITDPDEQIYIYAYISVLPACLLLIPYVNFNNGGLGGFIFWVMSAGVEAIYYRYLSVETNVESHLNPLLEDGNGVI